MTLSEVELIDRARAGDRSSLSELLQQVGPLVRRDMSGSIPKKWQSLISLDDVLQQTYTTAFLHIKAFESRGPGSFQAWLTALARNALCDVLRMLEADKRGGRRRRIENNGADESYIALYELIGTTSSTPSRDVARQESRAAVERAVALLPADYRKLIQMYDLEGRPSEEVAAALNRSLGAMYMLRSRAHQRLAEIIGTASQYMSRSNA